MAPTMSFHFERWVFRYKYVFGSEHSKYKARLVAKGFKQEHGVNYEEVLSPVVKITTFQYSLETIAVEELELEKMDMKVAFLHGDLHEEIYMSQPASFTAIVGDHLVCEL